jgi:3-hydroxybutyryl-CoA dehydrogenase
VGALPRRVTVIGAGTMGHGIAYAAALAGFEVALHDADAGALERARGKVETLVRAGLERGKLAGDDADRVTSGLRLAATVAEAAQGAQLVIEAVVEKLSVKEALFRELESHASPDAVLATNTSSLSIARIAAAVSHPQRVVGMHFFNPVHVMKLLEVVVHPGTDERTRETALAVGRRMGKEPILVRDAPGFASSRLGVVLGLEAMRMVEQEVASAEDIDKAMELGYRHPMGPLRLTDLVGLDVRLAIAEYLHAELGGEQYRPPEILRRKVAAGELGQKSGRGFYTWET